MVKMITEDAFFGWRIMHPSFELLKSITGKACPEQALWLQIYLANTAKLTPQYPAT
jgi:hypothetical protein